MRFSWLWIFTFCLAGCQNSELPEVGYVYDRVEVIQTVEDIPLSYRLDTPKIDGSAPLLVLIDGSSCRGPGTTDLRGVLKPDGTAPLPYGRVIVEKIGVGLQDDGESCSDLFLQNYSIEDRVLQHLRVFQHLRRTAPWWNGELLIWGWSDGGDIGAHLSAYYPNTKGAVLGAMGGGLTMAESFRDIDFCPADYSETADARKDCVDDLEARFDTIRRNPKWEQTWLGQDNSFKVWETRLFSRLSTVLKDSDVPTLIVHGQEDHGPIKGARILRDVLDEAGNQAFTFWEIKGMGHSPRPLADDEKDVLFTAMRDWLLLGDVEQPDLDITLKDTP